MPSILVCVLFTLIVLALLYKFSRPHHEIDYTERNNQLKKLRTVSLYSLPLIGQTLTMVGSCKRAFNVINTFLATMETPFILWISHVPTIHLAKLEDIEEFLRTCVSRKTFGIVEGTFGEGIVVHNHEKWKITRRLMTPAFGVSMLTRYLQVFDEQGKILVDLLRPNADSGETFDLWPFLINANIDVITENMMGIESNCQQNQGNEYSTAFLKTMGMTVRRALNPLLYLESTFKIYTQLYGIDKYLTSLYAYPKRAIENVKKSREADNTTQSSETSILPSDSDYDYDKVSKPMIELLYDAHVRDPISMTEKQIGIEMIHLLAAGSESTAIGSAFLMLMLGIHQDIQEIVYQEIVAIVPNEHNISTDKLNELKYLDRCIRETLRLYNVIGWSFRDMNNSLTLSSSGDVIPKDTIVVAHFKCVHLNPKYYPNPEKWNPDNFTAEAISGRPKNSFCAFGLGARNCPGYKYAMLSIKVQACHLLHNYHVSSDVKMDEIELRQDLLQRSANGYPIKLKARKHC